MRTFALTLGLVLLVAGSILADTTATSPVAAASPGGPAAGIPGVGLPASLFLTGCTASTDCPEPRGRTSTISCSGTTSCYVGYLFITCDGHATNCDCWGSDPGGSCGLCYCQCYENGGTVFQCIQQCAC